MSKVLVAEDNPGLARVLEFKLRQRGFEVVVCPDGQAAWDTVQEEPFDIVVTDFEMPHMNGAELCERIRAAEDLRGLPVMLVTAREPELDAKEMSDKGVCQIFSKPYSPRNLIAAIEQVIEAASKA